MLRQDEAIAAEVRQRALFEKTHQKRQALSCHRVCRPQGRLPRGVLRLQVLRHLRLHPAEDSLHLWLGDRRPEGAFLQHALDHPLSLVVEDAVRLSPTLVGRFVVDKDSSTAAGIEQVPHGPRVLRSPVLAR